MTHVRIHIVSALIVAMALVARPAVFVAPIVGGVLLNLSLADKASAQIDQRKKGGGAAAGPARAAPRAMAPRAAPRAFAPRQFQRHAAPPAARRFVAPRAVQQRNAVRRLQHAPRRALRAAPAPHIQTQRALRRDRIEQRRLTTERLQGIQKDRATVRRDAIHQQRRLQAERRRQQVQDVPALAGRSRALRRGEAVLLSQQAAAQGRFGARFHARAGHKPGMHKPRFAGRHAWRRGKHASFVAWVGPVFWPYVYSDIFDYTFFPYAYDEGFWAYAYDDFFDSVFWADGGPYADYAEAGPYAGDVTAALPGKRASAKARAQKRLAEQLCKQPGQGITAWPFEAIEDAVRPNAEQRALLAKLETAAGDAADTFKRTCSTEIPLTPPGRLDAMLGRLNATLDAVKTVRPALTAFYDSLSDEQRARFNAIGPEVGQRKQTAEDVTASVAARCGEAKPGLTNLPIEQISNVVRPTESQKDALDRLAGAAKDALAKLQAACPDDTPQTPTGRLDAIEQRLQAMIDAANIVKPALGEFYAALSNEQKARFNTMGLDDQRTGG
jgi:hypothetical protein